MIMTPSEVAGLLKIHLKTVYKLAEKGVPIPSELLTGPVETRTDLRRGLVLFFVGLALAIFLLEVSAPWSIGLIPMFAGLGYLISWKLEGKNAGTPQAKAAQSL